MAGYMESECNLRQRRLAIHLCIVIQVLSKCTPTAITMLMGPWRKNLGSRTRFCTSHLHIPPKASPNPKQIVSVAVPVLGFRIVITAFVKDPWTFSLVKILCDVTHVSSAEVDCRTRVVDTVVLLFHGAEAFLRS
jgi:hypothetical protein